MTLPKLTTSNTLSDLSLETEQRNVPLELAARSCIAPRWLRKCFTNSISSSSFFQNFMWPSQLPVIMKSVLWMKQKDVVCSNNYSKSCDIWHLQGHTVARYNFPDIRCLLLLCILLQGCIHFPRIRATSKFWMPEGWHEGRSILWTHKY